jgi:sirohydrochlorin cobaltochelatase
MVRDNYADAVLVLLGHGSTQDSGAGAAICIQAEEMRRRYQFADVREAFWKQEPLVNDVVAGLAGRRIFIVPMFVSEGYFSQSVIPQALGFDLEPDSDSSRVQKRKDQTVFYCKAIGSHDAMAGVLVARSQEVTRQFPFPRPPQPKVTTLFIAGHGTEQDKNSRRAIEHQARLVRNMSLYAQVHPVFLEEEPRIRDCWQMAQTTNIIVVPFFISDGMHVKKDIPLLLGEPPRVVEQRLQSGQPAWRNPTERNNKLLWYSSPVGTHLQVADIIFASVEEVASWSRP